MTIDFLIFISENKNLLITGNYDQIVDNYIKCKNLSNSKMDFREILKNNNYTIEDLKNMIK